MFQSVAVPAAPPSARIWPVAEWCVSLSRAWRFLMLFAVYPVWPPQLGSPAPLCDEESRASHVTCSPEVSRVPAPWTSSLSAERQKPWDLCWFRDGGQTPAFSPALCLQAVTSSHLLSPALMRTWTRPLPQSVCAWGSGGGVVHTHADRSHQVWRSGCPERGGLTHLTVAPVVLLLLEAPLRSSLAVISPGLFTLPQRPRPGWLSLFSSPFLCC